MTQPPDEYGDLLRRALRAEADEVVPSPEGLQIIRARIERRGARNLFWWRAGAAGVGAVLVAGAIVMAIPNLRSQIIEQTVAPVRVTSTETPSNSSTTRSHQPPAEEPAPQQSQPVVVVPETSAPPTPKPTRKAGSTSRPSPSPSPTPTTCPSPLAEHAEPPADCPEAAPSPTPTVEETTGQPSACPPEECPAPDEVTETPTELASPLLDTSQTTP
ncbi:hypothetical protein [Nonomuraea gerenzanensis]|uniref:Heavy metal translocating P-type ATPase n=1 Tax=Nonomuraea gerenzanensis TaxID=93944 RepID=A0A1M4E3V4_9ACTN|nr:hypothetical protein [Nonomuraea gerenzanensis]UBU15721.1 hypothetical protein LCN96_12085 [Nonomuraea gerenzanensis]SBO93497.1 heavy metal translocating P-type ATPase [Nonomuraea gerenzanensis]